YLLLGFIFSCLSTIISQSQTSFIAMLAGLFAAIIYFFVFGRRRQRKLSRIVIIWCCIVGFVFITYFFQELRYLATLIEMGTERNSYLLRLEKAAFVHQEITANPFLFIIG